MAVSLLKHFFPHKEFGLSGSSPVGLGAESRSRSPARPLARSETWAIQQP